MNYQVEKRPASGNPNNPDYDPGQDPKILGQFKALQSAVNKLDRVCEAHSAGYTRSGDYMATLHNNNGDAKAFVEVSPTKQPPQKWTVHNIDQDIYPL